MTQTGSFEPGREQWLERLGSLRNVVRQEMVSRQLARHLPTSRARVLDAAQAEGRDVRYPNGIGAAARGDHLDGLVAACESAGLQAQAWYGVRVATDDVASDARVPDDGDELAAIFDVEERFGAADPYRQMGALLHLVVRRSHSTVSAR